MPVSVKIFKSREFKMEYKIVNYNLKDTKSVLFCILETKKQQEKIY